MKTLKDTMELAETELQKHRPPEGWVSEAFSSCEDNSSTESSTEDTLKALEMLLEADTKVKKTKQEK